MTEYLINHESQLVIGELYKFEFRSDCKNNIKKKYTYYIYNGYKKSNNGAEYHEFMSNVKRYRTPVLAVYKNYNFYEYENGKNTSEYNFAANGYINSLNRLVTYNICEIGPDDDLYGYDEFCFNIYKQENY